MPKRRVQRASRPAFLMVLGLAALAMATLGAVLFRLVRDGAEEAALPTPVRPPVETQEPSYGRWGVMREDIAQNTYDPAAFSESGGVVSYQTDSLQALQGIDVSAHNGEIDWAAVRASGVDFAILQVGYRGYVSGNLAADASFYTNADAATANGIRIGAYFFSQALTVEEAEEEAQYAVQLLSGMQIDWPIYFDWEPVEAEARTNEMDTELLTSLARAFCRVVEEAGFRAGVYFNQELGYLHYNLAELENCDFWLAEYASAPTFYYHFEQWQYTNTGTVSGISTPVDRVLSFRDYRPVS